MNMKQLAFLFFGLFFSSEALASGSISLSYLLPLVSQNLQLAREVDSILASNGLSVDDVDCQARRAGRIAGKFAGLRVPPFVCDMKTKILTINATTDFRPKGNDFFDFDKLLSWKFSQ